MYCSACDRETKLEAHHADTTINDWETQYCTVCSYKLRSDAHHEHTFATVESDNQKHWGTCHCGETLEEEVHKWDIQTGKCSICHLENTASERSVKIGFFAWLWNLLFNR